MDAFEAYKHFLALKRHFTTKHYDYFKYKGVVNVKKDRFDIRNDKYFFHKLSKHKDLTNFLIALFAYGKQDLWIGDIMRNEESEKLYNQWLKVKQSLSYTFASDLEKFNEDLVSSFVVNQGQHPHALKLLLRKDINIETFIIINDILRFTSSWNRDIIEKIVWPEVRQRCKKYHPFLNYDKKIFNEIIVDKFNIKM